ncbi:hypothetical protein NQ176_g5002 [Zarea fungicola]|uniref:Uncharacterized protein n=1 Tax=Zarea fungicola TaxID=93591 RepID=A0ACC1NCK4_9HYPO|nr:hypothetical protein NQ176_g5002 [Lecanicillium fungicola]
MKPSYGFAAAVAATMAQPLLASPVASKTEGRDVLKLNKRSGVCNANNQCSFPSVAEIGANIRATTEFDFTRSCVFYLGLDGAEGQIIAKKWYNDVHPEKGKTSIVWGEAASSRWANQKIEEIRVALGPNDQIPDPLHPGQRVSYRKVWSALVSQGMAESCHGTVYFVTTGAALQNLGTTPVDNIWWNYELPALVADRKNNQVDQIMIADGTVKDKSGKLSDKGRMIWSKGKGRIGRPGGPAGNGYVYNFQKHV